MSISKRRNRLFSCIFAVHSSSFSVLLYSFTIFSPISSIRLLDCKFQSCFLSIVKFHSDHCTSFPDGFHVSLCIHRGNFFPAAVVSDAECGTSGRKFHPEPEGFSFFSVLFFAPIVTFFGACLTVTLMRQVFWFAVVTVITAFPFSLPGSHRPV